LNSKYERVHHYSIATHPTLNILEFDPQLNTSTIYSHKEH